MAQQNINIAEKEKIVEVLSDQATSMGVSGYVILTGITDNIGAAGLPNHVLLCPIRVVQGATSNKNTPEFSVQLGLTIDKAIVVPKTDPKVAPILTVRGGKSRRSRSRRSKSRGKK